MLFLSTLAFYTVSVDHTQITHVQPVILDASCANVPVFIRSSFWRSLCERKSPGGTTTLASMAIMKTYINREIASNMECTVFSKYNLYIRMQVNHLPESFGNTFRKLDQLNSD